MKLRIKGNTIRLRLSQTEVEKFRTEGLVKDQVQFASSSLTYLLELINESAITASFSFDTVRIGVPENIRDTWLLETEVGFDAHININEDNDLYILVEKDFQCLVVRKEDESDLYDNPMSNKEGGL